MNGAQPREQDGVCCLHGTRLAVILSVLMILPCFQLASSADDASAVDSEAALAKSNLALAAPIQRWDEAVPLGNGLLGGLLWGEGRNVKLSLDRGDIWDCRVPEKIGNPDWNYATLCRLVAEKKYEEMLEMFEFDTPELAYPTKLPAGRIELNLDESQSLESFGLDLPTATGRAHLAGSAPLEVFFSAVELVALMRVPGDGTVDFKIIAPGIVEKLGYEPAAEGREDRAGDTVIKWFVQDAANEVQYVVAAGARKIDGATLIAVCITTRSDDPQPLALARERITVALDAGWEAARRGHLAWWKAFWSTSSVTLPDAAIQQQYDLTNYFLGSASRRGAPPIPLQGVWTADDGELPPWRGEYANNINTQMTYWAYLGAGHFDEGAALTDYLWDLAPRHRAYAEQFCGTPGIFVPVTMALDGSVILTWAQVTFALPQGSWLAHSFYLHWRYTMDEQFLRTRAYPYCVATAEGLLGILQPDANGKLKLPLSTSPEIWENRLRAWLTPNSNSDLSIMRWLFAALVEMSEPAGQAGQVGRWKDVLDTLDDLAVEGQDGPLKLAPDESLTYTHRHHSHLMAIHPFGTLHVEGSDRDRRIIETSIDRLDALGTEQWVGFSFPWYSCIAARAGYADRALDKLEIFVKAFVSRNGFNLNGDYKDLGYSAFKYRPFTLEANFGAVQAVHEMLLQSWGSAIRVFPAVSDRWADVSFENLHAEGGFRVSAKRRDGRTHSVRIQADAGGLLRLRDPFDGADVTWNRDDVKRVGQDYECRLAPGEMLEGRL